jgi:hypothetical protein
VSRSKQDHTAAALAFHHAHEERGREESVFLLVALRLWGMAIEEAALMTMWDSGAYFAAGRCASARLSKGGGV